MTDRHYDERIDQVLATRADNRRRMRQAVSPGGLLSGLVDESLYDSYAEAEQAANLALLSWRHEQSKQLDIAA